MSWNTYKGSTRDGIKCLSKNGTIVPFSPNWGWGGSKTLATALFILEMEYGPKTAAHMSRHVAGWLARQPDDKFTLTSGTLWFIVNKCRVLYK